MTGDDPGGTSDSGLAELAGQLLAVLDEFSADTAGQIRERVPFYAGDSMVSAEDPAPRLITLMRVGDNSKK